MNVAENVSEVINSHFINNTETLVLSPSISIDIDKVKNSFERVKKATEFDFQRVTPLQIRKIIVKAKPKKVSDWDEI